VVVATASGREIVVVMDPRDVARVAAGEAARPAMSVDPPAVAPATSISGGHVATDGSSILAFAASALQSPPQRSPWAPRVYALDKNCYHIGYPIDLGAIEELPVACARGTVPGNSAASTAAAAVGLLSEQASVMCLSCPLHNRLFELATGDLVAIDYSKREGLAGVAAVARSGSAAGASAAEGDAPLSPLVRGAVVTRGKRQGGVAVSAGCHQRPHRATVAPSTGRIVVYDASAPITRAPGEMSLAGDCPPTTMVNEIASAAHGQLPSDEQNGPSAKPFD
jgi:nitrite reductase/ring-hydroxylating ferredoxin subunit